MTETNKTKKKTSRIEAHNLGTHEERMSKRRALQRLRTTSLRVKTGFFTPHVEDKKHQSWREALIRISQ